MATGKALDGKPYAGNPHVRFDEGEVASAATPRRGSLLYKNVFLGCLFAALAAAGASYEPALGGEVSIKGAATQRVEMRIARDLNIRCNMAAVKAFCFDIRVSDPADFASLVLYFKSGDGWYRTLLELPEDAVAGGWYPMAVSAADKLDTEGKPAGLKNVEAVRIAGYRATTNAVSITLRNVRFDVSKPEAFVIGESPHAANVVRRIEALGVETRLMSVDDLAPRTLDGVPFVVLPTGRPLPSGADAIVKSYVKGGGKLLRFNKRLSDQNALLEEVDRLLSGARARFEKRRAEARAEEARVLAALRAMPSRSGERRLIWCHSAWGLGGTNDWDSTVGFIKRNGFTDLLVNLAWGGYAYYPSKVLPQAEAARGDALELCRAACRKYGVKMHVWKVCWKMGRAVSPEFVRAARDAGRVQRTREGEFDDLWNCPSDPYSQQLEIDAMTELALEKKVDGIHFDYIRYPGPSCCFCDGCRKRFEAQLGRPVANWPRATQSDAAVAAAWKAFRCANITRVVKAVHDRVRAAHSGVEMSAAVFRDPERDRERVAQEWVRWCAEGWLDFVCPMDYMKSPSRYAKRIASQKEALRQAGSKATFYPGMAIMCSHFEKPLTPLVVAQEIAAVRAEGLDGFTLFSLSRVRDAESVLPLLREGPLAED
ncbi:MAG: family 10 glycosylhydrolase [Kiritimatiellae bacterium]|nr:family 10 glycosylhydrolase [Kiritimatiellia bacterium]